MIHNHNPETKILSSLLQIINDVQSVTVVTLGVYVSEFILSSYKETILVQTRSLVLNYTPN